MINKFMLFFMIDVMFCFRDSVDFFVFMSVKFLRFSLKRDVWLVLRVLKNIFIISFSFFFLFLFYLKIMLNFGGLLK